MIYINIHSLIILSLRNIPINNAIIAGGKLNNNSSTYFEKEMPKNPGDISRIPNHPEDKFIERSDNDCSTVNRETKCIF